MKFGENCFICVMRQVFIIGFSSVFLADFDCPHISNLKHTYMKETKWTHFRCACVNIFFYIMLIIDLINITDVSNVKHIITLASKLWMNIFLVVLDVYNHYITTIHINCYNSLVELISNLEFYGIKILFSRVFTIRANVALSLFGGVYFGMYLFSLYSSNISAMSTIQFLGMLSAGLLHLAYITYYVLNTEVHYMLFIRCFTQIKLCLKRRHPRCQEFKIFKEESGNFKYYQSLSLEDKLKLQGRLYLSILEHYYINGNVVSNPHITLLPVCFVVMLFNSSYLFMLDMSQGFYKINIANYAIFASACVDVLGLTIEASRITSVVSLGVNILFYPVY